MAKKEVCPRDEIADPPGVAVLSIDTYGFGEGLVSFRTLWGANPTLYARKKLSGLFEKFPKVQLEKQKGGDSAPGCRASKLLDFRPLLHLFLKAVSLRPGTCWLFIHRMHFHIGSGQCIVSLDFHFL